ncbi:MAG: cytochrome P450 [Parvibaculum sedimenti]|uniref:cytochrome P450 n=1 Tax=Parvibaculum sedimenti TaxID=2608632 RepID=UPI003BB6FF66
MAETLAKDGKSNLPMGAGLTALDEDYRENLYQVLDDVRERAPVLRDTELNHVFVTRHDDVKAVLRDRDLLVDPRTTLPDDYVRLFTPDAESETYEPSMLFLDDPDHRRLRGIVTQAFNPRSIEAMRPRIEAIAKELLDEMEGKSEVDFITAYAAPLPTIVIADMLGVERERRADFKRWSDDIVQAFDPLRGPETTARMNASQQAMRDYFTATIAERRAKPGADLISDLIRAEEDGAKLNNREVLSMCTLLLTAGNVTTTDLIGNGMHALLTHPAELAKLKADPSLIVNAVEEMLRYDGPVTDSGRHADRDIVIGGCPIERGRTVTTSLAAANHDPSVYPEPHKFDVTRADTHNQSFGGGMHICLGAPLARLEAQVAINMLLGRFPNITLGREQAVRRHLPAFRGFERMVVTL